MVYEKLKKQMFYTDEAKYKRVIMIGLIIFIILSGITSGFFILAKMQYDDVNNKYGKTNLIVDYYESVKTECVICEDRELLCTSYPYRCVIHIKYSANYTVYTVTAYTNNHKMICGLNSSAAIINAKIAWPPGLTKEYYYLRSDPTNLTNVVIRGEIYFTFALIMVCITIFNVILVIIYLRSRRIYRRPVHINDVV